MKDDELSEIKSPEDALSRAYFILDKAFENETSTKQRIEDIRAQGDINSYIREYIGVEYTLNITISLKKKRLTIDALNDLLLSCPHPVKSKKHEKFFFEIQEFVFLLLKKHGKKITEDNYMIIINSILKRIQFYRSGMDPEKL